MISSPIPLVLQRGQEPRICACTVTSRAVVGSSAIRSFGSQAMATAIITRWAMPPGQLVGEVADPLAGHGMPTRSSRSAARSRAARGQVGVGPEGLDQLAADGERRVEAPTGSWNTMPMSRPRMSGAPGGRRGEVPPPEPT